MYAHFHVLAIQSKTEFYYLHSENELSIALICIAVWIQNDEILKELKANCFENRGALAVCS